MNISEISKKNADKLGSIVNSLQTIEECGELIKAICKYNRVCGIGQVTETSYEDAKQNLIEELADVSICIEQMIYLLCFEEQVKEAREKAFEKVRKRYE